MKKSILLLAFIIPALAHADIYKLYWTEENLADPENNPDDTSWQSFKLINVSSHTVIDGTMSGYYSHTYADLISAASAANGGGSYDMERSLSNTGRGPTIIDFTGSSLTFRTEQGVAINPNGQAGDAYVYDEVITLNVETGEVTSRTLIASTQASGEMAEELGYTVDYEISDVDRSGSGTEFQSYAVNITNENGATDVNVGTDGGFVAEKISNPDGTSLIRKEDDGTVHIGQNSIVLADELVSNSGYDQIYSSSGVLELGNTSSHRTVITGTLEIQDPTAPGHAATKRYADGIAALSNAIAIMPRAPEGKSMLTLGTGYLDGESALAIGVSSRPVDSDLTFNFATSYNKTVSTPAFAAGVGWEF